MPIPAINFMRGRQRVPPLDQVLAHAATRPVFLASGHVTLSGTGDVLSWHDSNDDTHVLTQADTALQVDPPAAHAGFGGALALNITALGQFYSSNQAGAAWIWLVDGTGYCNYNVVDLTSPLVAGRAIWSLAWLIGSANVNLTTNGVGAVLYRPRVNGADYGLLNIGATSGPRWIKTAYDEASSPEMEIKLNGIAAITADAAETVAPAPSETFRLGRSYGAVNAAFQHGRAYMFFPTLTAPQQAIVEAYIQADTGITP